MGILCVKVQDGEIMTHKKKKVNEIKAKMQKAAQLNVTI